MSTALESMGRIRPDFPEPLWVQAVNLITEEIASGVLTPGMRLPPERELCQQLNISRVTLRKALTSLVDDGVLNASHGRGWFVAARGASKEWPNSLESFTEAANRMGLTPTSRVLRAEVAPANLDEADQLSIAPGTPLFHLERIRFLNGVPIAVDRTAVPAESVPDFAARDFSEESLYTALSEVGLDFLRADSTIEAREADAYLAEHLDVAEGKPVLAMHQIVFDRADKPMFASTIRYSGERYRMRTFFARAGAFNTRRQSRSS